MTGSLQQLSSFSSAHAALLGIIGAVVVTVVTVTTFINGIATKADVIAANAVVTAKIAEAAAANAEATAAIAVAKMEAQVEVCLCSDGGGLLLLPSKLLTLFCLQRRLFDAAFGSEYARWHAEMTKKMKMKVVEK